MVARDEADMSSLIHQEVVFKASPNRVYEALLDERQFSKLTGAAAEISREAGGSFSCFGGYISGRNIELIPNKRIVQAWRPKDWEEGVYSIVKFELKGQGSETKLVMDHSGFPEERREHLDSGWSRNYWQPLRDHLAY